MDRRETLRTLGMAGLGTGIAALMGRAGRAAAAAPVEPAAKSGMRHRSYSGKISYITDGIGDQGREFFTVTVQPDGTRTLRAQVEMDNIRLLRDVVLTVDKDFHPIDAFVRLVKEEKFLGCTWYKFTEHTAICEGYTDIEGRISQSFESAERINLFTCHPINCDAWLWAAVRNNKDYNPYPWFNSSPRPNGDTGPTLIRMEEGHAVIAKVGIEKITTPAGAFEALHYQLGGHDSATPPLNTWVLGEDCVPVRLRSEGHRQTYELVELRGDPR